MNTIKTTLTALLITVFAATTTLSVTGCASGGMRRSTGEFIDDGALTAKVKTAVLRDTVVRGMDVGINSYRGVVQLNGWVDTAEQKARAEELARAVEGVEDVQNHLAVREEQEPR
jgi:osmotically-inducible protein OsmY